VLTPARAQTFDNALMFSHDADSIRDVDQSVGARVENVAGDVFDYSV
jgi:hypothetical protein